MNNSSITFLLAIYTPKLQPVKTKYQRPIPFVIFIPLTLLHCFGTITSSLRLCIIQQSTQPRFALFPHWAIARLKSELLIFYQLLLHNLFLKNTDGLKSWKTELSLEGIRGNPTRNRYLVLYNDNLFFYICLLAVLTMEPHTIVIIFPRIVS